MISTYIVAQICVKNLPDGTHSVTTIIRIVESPSEGAAIGRFIEKTYAETAEFDKCFSISISLLSSIEKL